MNRRRNRRATEILRQAWADYLRRFVWDYVVTLTFDRRCGRAGALAHTRRWIQRTPKQRRGHAFLVIERGAHGLWHSHLLIGGVGELTRPRLKREWGRGFVHVQAYDRERGVAFYLAKFTFDDDAEYDLDTFNVEDSAKRVLR